MHSQPMRILLVEDNPGDARLLVEEIREQGRGAFELEIADTLASAITRVSSGHFEAALLDLNLPDSHGLETFLSLHQRYRDLPIVLLTGLEDEGLGLRAVQEGAQDFLVKGQTSGSAVVRALRYAIERNRSLQWHRTKSRHVAGGKVISFLGVKGGVGTTTLALNAAAVLAQEKLVIAAELRGDYGSFPSHFRKLGGSNLGELLAIPANEISDMQIEQRLLNSQLGFYLLFAPQMVDQFIDVTPDHAERLLAHLTQMAEYVVLDLPPVCQAYHKVALRRSNAVVLVAERDDSSLAAAKMMLDRLKSWGVPHDALEFAMVNRSPILDGLSREKAEEMLGLKIAGIVPPSPDICVAAQKAGAPLSVFRPRSAPAAVLSQIALRAAAIAHGARHERMPAEVA